MSGPGRLRRPQALVRRTRGRLLGALRALPQMRRSVAGKFVAIVLLTTVSVLAVAITSIVVHDLSVYRESWAQDITTEANLLSLSVVPAIAFDDPVAAQNSLHALKSRPAVIEAAIFRPDGRLYARYVRGGQGQPSSAPPRLDQGVRMSGQSLELSRPIQYNGESLGTLYVFARYDLAERIQAYVGIFAVITALSLVCALLLATPLLRIFIEPVESIAGVARRIVEQRDYSLRASRTTDDEIGIVVDAFNGMLDEVQERTRALESSNASLRSEVAVRQVAEQALANASARLESTMAAAEVGSWIWNLERRQLTFDRNFAALYGFADEASLRAAPDLRLARVHPDDRAAVESAEQDALVLGLMTPVEFRILQPEGPPRWVMSRGRVMRDADGRAQRVAGLLIDITAQKRAEENLKRTEDALREADRRKDDFLATLAHELRNPLGPIRHATHILGSPAASEAQRAASRDVIARQVQHMALLLDDLLEISRITRGRLELRRSPSSLDELVRSALEVGRPLIEEKGHRVEVHLPRPVPVLDVDPLRISQALANLLTNAAKYTDPGGRITVCAVVDDQGLRISVSDTGIGLDADVIPGLFEMFSQVRGVLERSQGGLGIGLALVKGLLELHGGTVQASSTGPGGGSTFTLVLPASVLCPGPAAPEPGEPSFPGPADESAANRILVADDNRDSAESLADLLRLDGYDVRVATSGPEALEIARAEPIGMLILDIGMPGMTGYEVAERIRREETARVQRRLLIALTGWGRQEDIERAHAAGFDHHLRKPVDLSELASILSTHGATEDGVTSV